MNVEEPQKKFFDRVRDHWHIGLTPAGQTNPPPQFSQEALDAQPWKRRSRSDWKRLAQLRRVFSHRQQGSAHAG